MNLKLFLKRGFTIVELVIVIAVIAILAGVLIPTFSGVVSRANLSADKQAVREMNMALAADESINGRPANIEGAMTVLANAGYNSDNWVCLTRGYEVYWYETDNRLVLYNASTASVEYPETYPLDLFVTAGTKLHIYNENHIKAVNYNTSIGSYEAGTSKSASEIASSASTDTAKAALESVSSALSSNTSSQSSELKQALGLSSNSEAYVYATTEKTSKTADSNAWATMQLVSVGETAEPDAQSLQSDGKTLKTNLFYISVNKKEGVTLTPQEQAQASAAAGDMVYNVFTQVNTGQLDQDVAIVFDAGTELDVSGKEWSAIKEFSGYFGTTDPDHPLVINGAELTASTGYSQTVSFTGSGSKYFVTGFIGTMYGEATVENITFKNITFQEPASDFELASFKINGKGVDSRNTIGIIGGITDGAKQKEANVVIRNVVVEDSVTMNCSASGASLIGYIGSAESSGKLGGNILIENCHISGKVNTNYQRADGKHSSTDYGPVGGLIGFLCRADNVNLTIKDVVVDAEVNGTNMVCGLIGNVISVKSLTLSGNIDLRGVKLTGKETFSRVRLISHLGTNIAAKITNNATIQRPEGTTYPDYN